MVYLLGGNLLVQMLELLENCVVVSIMLHQIHIRRRINNILVTLTDTNVKYLQQVLRDL
jgi:hypothetical protein